jgi:hypothetical protein
MGAVSQSVEKLFRLFSLRVTVETRNRPLKRDSQTGNYITDGFLDPNFLIQVYSNFLSICHYCGIISFANETKVLED